MKIYSKLVIDIATGEIASCEAFDYDGHVARAKGGKGGGGGGSSAETSLTQSQANIANTIFGEATPLRQALVGSVEQRLGLEPTYEPSDVALFGPSAPERQAVESQYTNAKNNIMSSIPTRGSEMNKNLAGLEAARAGDIGQMESDATMRALGLASDIGLGTSSTALSGFNNARVGASATATRDAQMAGASAQGKGQTAGMLMGK